MSRVTASGVRRTMAAIVAVGLVALIATDGATAGRHRVCGTVQAAGSVWSVEATGVPCRFARAASRRLAPQRPFGYGASLLRKPPPAFDCVGIPDASGRQVEGYCTRLGGAGFSWERRA